MEKILILDNYDSFTYNIVHLLHELGAEVDIARNDRISVEEAGRYNRIILSPGPGIPSEAGILPEVVICTPVRVIAEEKMFSGLGESFDVGRYHSWVVSRKNLPECLTVTAEDAAGRIMALSHKSYDVRGLQFHPESILTPMGKMMMANWLYA